MYIDRWIAVAAFAWTILATLLAFFSITSDRLNAFLVNRRIKKLPDIFMRLAEEYRLADKIPDNSTAPVKRPPSADRVREKNLLAARLGGYALGSGIRRTLLAKVADDGYLVALAIVIMTEPKPSDVPLLAEVARYTIHKVPAHVDYTLMRAIEAVAEAGLIQPSDQQSMRAALDQIQSRLGEDHKARVTQVREIVRAAKAH